MSKATLETAFKELRDSRGQSLRDIGGKCAMSETTPWKIENGRTVRWETVHRILTEALKCQPGSPDYENIHRLWLAQRQQIAESQPKDHGKQKLSKHAASAVYDFRKLVKGRKQDDVESILAAAVRASDRLRASRKKSAGT